ncbi:PKD domain-containing protein [Nocardioides sp. YIM 152588]|uniref:PKD domain-containing protein n=1 Tax=Nocardioides sp. YIM 152588 TaxID=3158259 RepID=UPI0032E3E59B
MPKAGSGLKGRRARTVAALSGAAAVVAAALAVVGATASPARAVDLISFRAAAEAAANRPFAEVTIPAEVQDADGMLLFVSTNKSGLNSSAPTGWTLEGTEVDGKLETALYSKVATAGDAGTDVRVTFPVRTKSTIQLLAYDGTADDPVATVASTTETTRRAAHTTPGASVATDGSMVVSYWADRAGGGTGWTLPASQTQRSIALGSGSGRTSSVASDDGAPVAAGGTPSRTATSAASTRRATMWTVVLEPGDSTATPPPTGEAVPGHTRLVPDRPRTDTPRIEDGEIVDIEVVPSLNRVFIAGTFSGAQNTTGANQGFVSQPGLLSYNYETGLIDTSFRPSFNGGVAAVEASPDGTKLFVGGSFNTVNGTAAQKVASLDLTTGAPLGSFVVDRSTNNQVQSLATTDDTLYVGGRFSRINGVLRTGVAAMDTDTGAVIESFDNSLSGGIGVNGALGVPQLKLTHDATKLIVIHTARKIDGQDRLGMGIIDTATEELLPWRSTLWDENLARVGGVTRICCGDVAPDDSYFVVTSGSGGDRPPISDTVVAYPLDDASLEDSDVQPLWISRHFDSIYSVAITEVAIYVGGHFGWAESPTSEDPWPGLDNVGYGTGQGLSGYGLGDQVVRRDHIAALNPVDGKAVEWNPNGGSNSFEGDKAMEATPRGLFIGGDGQFKGGVRTGRVGFFDFDTEVFPPALPETTIETPIEGRVVEADTEFTVTGTAEVATGTVGNVQVQIRDRNSGQYLQDDGTTFGGFNNMNATLDGGSGTTRGWSLPATVSGNRELLVRARAVTTGGTRDSTWADKKFESFGLSDLTPATSISEPRGTVDTLSFTVSGTASDDFGVSALTFWFRDDQGRYLQDDGTVDDLYNTFRGTPDVIGATSATWSYDVTLPHEGEWRGSATAIDTAGQADLRSATRDWFVSTSAVAPTVTMTEPVAVTPPFTVPTLVVEPGSPMTFAGTATDDEGLHDVEIRLRNRSTGENLGSDGSWGTDVSYRYYRVSPVDIAGFTYNWSYTTPFDLSPGTYDFQVRATDDDGLTTSSSNRARLTVSAEFEGDAPPDTGIEFVAPLDESLDVDLAGTATDDFGVESVQVSLQDRDTGRYLQADGSLALATAYRTATLDVPGGTSVAWSLPTITLPTGGNWRFTALAFDARGQQDPSAPTASYAAYPNDDPPALSETLGQPQDGSAFDQGRIVVTGRAEDAPNGDVGIASVQIAVQDAAGLFMGSTGSFGTSESWRSAFLNSPGSAGSNYSYTTPVLPEGTYTVRVRGVDIHGQVGEERVATGVTVTLPPNDPPVATFTYSCDENVCTFDGRGSSDENPTALTYRWDFGGQGSASGPLPTKTFTSAGTFAVTLTVTDEWNVSTTSDPQDVTITEPAGNVAPEATFLYSCTDLTCAVSSSGTADPNAGDSISYLWDWGDGATSTSSSPSHAYLAPGTYDITFTVTDGWGLADSVTESVTVTEPAPAP